MAHEIDPATGHGPPLAEPPTTPTEEHAHPTFKTYLKVALILTIITVVEVWVYYTTFVESKLFVPSLLLMSAAKFAIVVMFYMHLKYDHPLFRALFTGPLIIAALTLASLLLLFGKVAVRLKGG